MRLEQTLFLAIDKIFDRFQNGKRLDLTGLKAEYDVVYDENMPDSGRADIYMPAQPTGKMPVMMYIHGGGFVAGDKHYRRYWCAQFAKMGFCVFNVNYALCPKYYVHTAIHQTVHAVQWIEQQAEERGLDLSLFIISGDSAGGYLASETAAIINKPDLHERFGYTGKAHIDNAILISGLYDLTALMNRPDTFKLNNRMCYTMCKLNISELNTYEYYDVIEPIKLMDENFPDCFLVYAEKDVFCAGQGELLEKRLRELGRDVRTFVASKFINNHCFNLNYKDKMSRVCNRQIYDYVGELLAKRENKD